MKLTDEYQQLVANAASHEAQMVGAAAQEVVANYARPSVIYRPTLNIDGDQWCALYGENLQEGVAGFGDSPAAAMVDFDREWAKPLAKRAASTTFGPSPADHLSIRSERC